MRSSKRLLFILTAVIIIGGMLLADQLGFLRTGPSVDLLITGGRVVDGSGTPSRVTDVGTRGDRIVFIGDAAENRVNAVHTIDASGLVVAPGFIDPHTHSMDDLSDSLRHSNLNYLMQGVTTVVTGNDGGGPVEIAETLSQWENLGIGTNAALLVGHGTVRRRIMDMSDAAPSPEQLSQMQALVREAMEQGAIGLSTGLYYAPGSYAKTEEVIALAKIAAEYQGIYDSHMRDESSYTIGLLGSIKETIRIGREAAIPVNISHIKALGPDVWGQSADVVELIKQARTEGIKVTADQYPYIASGTSITAALVPRWAQTGGQEVLLKRLDTPRERRRILKDMKENLRRRGGPASLLISAASHHPEWVGKTLQDLAEDWHKAPLEAAIDIIKAGNAGVASFNMNEEDLAHFMQQDFVMTGSDGSRGHPRKYGTYPKKLRGYVYTKPVITLPFAIRASSALVAETFGFRDRGIIREGAMADIIVFDDQKLADQATFEQPEKFATGMRFVIVNGQLPIEDGVYMGVLAGRALKR